MSRKTVLLATLVLLALVPPAVADGFYFKAGLLHYDAPNVGLTGLPGKYALWGAGGEIGGRFGANSSWGWNLGGGFSTGGLTFEDTFGNRDEIKLKGWYARGGVDYHTTAGPADLYCGPSVILSSSTLEVEQTAVPTEKFEPYQFIGVENRVGSGVPVAERINLFGEASAMIGRGTIDDPAQLGGKITSWDSAMGYRGGLMVKF